MVDTLYIGDTECISQQRVSDEIAMGGYRENSGYCLGIRRVDGGVLGSGQFAGGRSAGFLIIAAASIAPSVWAVCVTVVGSMSGQPARYNQHLLFANVYRLLRTDGWFIGVDVAGGTRLAKHFDHSVAHYCLTGYQAKWLTPERLDTGLSEGAGLRLLRVQVILVGMRFSSVMQLALFITVLHAYDLANQQVIADLDEFLGFVDVDSQVVLTSPLLLFHTSRRPR